MKINTIRTDDSKYLQILANIAKCPARLDYIGALPEERIVSVTIVGTRKPTVYGKEVTQRFSRELAKQGIVIVSGLAFGVDALAHKAALEVGGTTIAVLGCGLPKIYPAAHKGLADEIVKSGGAIISEYKRDEDARPYYFLERNRIVSCLSDAIIITEASAKSGTLNTAAHALEQGKEVFVVPGNITSASSVGCNALLKQGARVLTDVSDILDVIAPTRQTAQISLPLGHTELESRLISLLAQGMRDGDQLVRKLDISQAEFATTLTMLELAGSIRALGGNQWTLR